MRSRICLISVILVFAWDDDDDNDHDDSHDDDNDNDNDDDNDSHDDVSSDSSEDDIFVLYFLLCVVYRLF